MCFVYNNSKIKDKKAFIITKKPSIKGYKMRKSEKKILKQDLLVVLCAIVLSVFVCVYQLAKKGLIF